MQTKFDSLAKRPVIFLAVWVLVFYLAMLFSVFVHEVGHGFGARLEGAHVSTGFNQVGNYGKSPGDPDFRIQSGTVSVLGGLLGPFTTWILAIIFTLWLYRFKELSWPALTIAALAIVNGLIRALPNMGVLVGNLLKLPHMEDEVGWAIWAILKYCQPAGIGQSADAHTLLVAHPGVFLAEPIFWILPSISLVISLACLITSYRKLFPLWGEQFSSKVIGLLAVCPLIVYFTIKPLQEILDNLFRINW